MIDFIFSLFGIGFPEDQGDQTDFMLPGENDDDMPVDDQVGPES